MAKIITGDGAISEADRIRFRDLLTHMLGAGSHIPKKQHGYRNRFCAELTSSHFADMLAMERLGLVQAGGKINEGRMQYFRATTEGCKEIGLSKAATKRAFED